MRARRRRDAARRARRDGGRHPAQRRARAGSAGLHCDRGIVVNDTHADRSIRRIYAVGECVAHRGDRPTASWRRCSRWRRSAPTTWRNCGIGRYVGSQTSTKLKVTGIDLFSAGDFTGGAGHRGDRADRSALGGVYKKLVLKRRQARSAAVLYGDTVDGVLVFPAAARRRRTSPRSATS